MLGTIISIMEGVNITYEFYKRASSIFKGAWDIQSGCHVRRSGNKE